MYQQTNTELLKKPLLQVAIKKGQKKKKKKKGQKIQCVAKPQHKNITALALQEKKTKNLFATSRNKTKITALL